jgi:pimeloyl-ACP methyl ester carboxylesterase
VTTFTLIHGAMMGGWCWERVEPALRSRGHDVVVVDLPCDDVAVGFDGYIDVVLDASASVRDDDLVLVGHSLGAHTAVRASKRRGVRAVVFVCGVIPPRAGESNEDEPPLEAPGAFDGAERDELGRFYFPRTSDAIRDMFHACTAHDAVWAASLLRRQSTTPHGEINEPVSPPDAPSLSIVCADDRVATAEWGRWAAAERLLGAPVVELAGDHSPFISRPAELADAIVGVLS